MKTKERIYKILEESQNEFISGEKIAETLSLSRAAVWKAINALKKDGYKIEAVTNKGYRLTELNLSVTDKISSGLDAAFIPENFKVFTYACVSSTNDLAKDYGISYPGSFGVFIADSQTNGRGRRGRAFFSPDSTGMYMSILLNPRGDISKIANITCLTAQAVCDAIEECLGLAVKIKWVNDIFYDNKKVCGILTEAQTSIEDGRLSYVVIGIGINLYTPDAGFPDDIKNIAGSLLKTAPSADDKNNLYASIINNFFKYYNNPDPYSFSQGYIDRSMLIGCHVKVISHMDPDSPDNKIAYVTGIDKECRLLVKYEDGTEASLSSGEVSVLKFNE